MSSNLEWNKQVWASKSKWEGEWNHGYGWGDVGMVRIDFARFVTPYIPHLNKPAVLEIACGMGRFTELLLEMAGSLHSIDIQEICVEECRKRFKDAPNFTASVTDGVTLPEGTFDLIASYDSLVHADYGVLAEYFRQANDRLREGGIVMIHHANRPDPTCSRWGVTAEMIKEFIERETPQLFLLSQTLMRYSQRRFVDCVTVCQKRTPEAEGGGERRVLISGQTVRVQAQDLNEWCKFTNPGTMDSRLHPNAVGQPNPSIVLVDVNVEGKRYLRTSAVADNPSADNPGAQIDIALHSGAQELARASAELLPMQAVPLELAIPAGLSVADVRITVANRETSTSNAFSGIRLGPIQITAT